MGPLDAVARPGRRRRRADREAERAHRVEIDAADYARRWGHTDTDWIRQYTRDELPGALCPWLKQRGYAADSDDPVLDRFLAILGNRPAHLRPGLRLKRRWDRDQVQALDARASLRP